jgi:hypothetical protein
MAILTPLDPPGYDHDQAIVETMPEPLLVLAPDLRVLRANASFYGTFYTGPEQVEGRLLSELGQGQGASATLREALTAALIADRPLHGLEMTAAFEPLGRRTLLLNAQRLAGGGDGAGDSDHDGGHHATQASGNGTDGVRGSLPPPL